MNRLLLSLSVLFLLLLSCQSPHPQKKAVTPVAAKEKPVVDPDSLVLQTTREILGLLRQKKYKQLTPYISPDKGVRFSAYTHIDTTSDLTFTPKDFRWQVGRKIRERRNWGFYDGSGEPIELTFGEYADEFIYDADFLHAEKTVVNQTLGFGNTIDNLEEIYKGKPYTCSYFSGFDEQYDGMDWCSLRLVYEIKGGKAWLIAVVHNQWTI